MENPFLVGERIYLRPIEEADAASYVHWLNDGEVSRFLDRRSPLNVLRELEYIGKMYTGTNDLTLPIVLKDGDRHVGGVGLHRMHQVDRKAVFGVFIGEADCWGQGYGPEVTRLVLRHSFRTLNLNRISLHVKEFNVRGIRAYEKVGFVQEGILRQDHYHDGRYHNVILVAILKDEWEALEAGDTAS